MRTSSYYSNTRGLTLHQEFTEQNGDDNDSKIETMVVDYAKSRDVNVNNCYIIRYRGCDTIIGCKIMVLDDYVEVALRREPWPEHIVCRIWERPEVWNKIRDKRKH